MAEIRNRNSVQVNEAGKQKLIEAKAAKHIYRNYKKRIWTYLDIAEASGVGEKTVKRFFAGESVDCDNAIAIAKSLNLELAELIDPKESNPPDATPETRIGWRDIYHKMLEEQLKRYQFRRQATGTGLGHEVGIYVPLGLVKPTTQPRRGEEFCPSPDEGRLQYQLNEKEIEKRFEADAFLREVIEAGEGKTIAIIGEPGAGKSTWLEQIARHLKDSENVSRLPICIQMGSLDGKTLEEYLLQVWLKEALSLQGMTVSAQMETELMQLFNSHQVWLLLDGVDEIRGDTSTGANSSLQGIANQLRGWVAQAQTLLTCRLNVWQANDRVVPNCDVYRTLDFDDSQVGKFIEEWFAKAGKLQLGKQLREKLGESGQERIRDLIRNPLRLALLCQTWAVKQGELPKTKATLYQRFREDFYEWKKNEFPISWQQRQELNAALGRLAVAAIEKQTPLRESLAYQVMGESLFELAQRIGWLNLVYRDGETDEPVYAFYHLTFQEYFAALAIDDWHFFLTHDNDNPQPLPGNIYRIFEPQWKEVILLWLGQEDVESEQKEEFIQALLEFDDGCGGFYRYRAYFLASDGIAEFIDYSRADEIVTQLIKWSFGYFNFQKKQWRTFLEPIAKGAKAALQQTERIRTINTLVALFQDDLYEHTKHEVAEILEQIGTANQKAIEALIQFLDSESNNWRRCTIARSLGQIDSGNQKAIQILIYLILEAPEPDLNNFAAQSLEKIAPGNSEIIHSLSEMLHLEYYNKYLSMQLSDIEAQRFWAAENLLLIAPDNQEAIKVLIELLRKDELEHEWIRIAAIGMLPRIKTNNEELINFCHEILDSEPDEMNRCDIARALGMVDPGCEKAVQTLIKLLQKDELHIRSHAASCLEDIGEKNEEAINALTRLLEWTDSQTEYNSHAEYIRWHAAKALGRIDAGNSKAITVLTNILKNSKEFCKVAANSLKNTLVNGQYLNMVKNLQGTLELSSEYGYENEAWKDPYQENFCDLFLDIYLNIHDSYSCKYATLWYCTDRIRYPAFYQALHSRIEPLDSKFLIIPKPSKYIHYFLRSAEEEITDNAQDISDIDADNPTPTNQNINPSDIPKLLHAAINNDSHMRDKVQPICIDSSKFENSDNPASEIYAEMVMQGCPERQNGEPETMQALKVYCQLKCQGVFLIFYEATSGETPQGFSQTFLTSLSKFNNARRICVVSEQPCNLQTFSPSQPNLVADIVSWIREKMMEE
ncbi:HEAT repeat domain-containing protein [Coleofasciculus sp. FACHB-SPT36]|uniref:NACHT C-terminal alpha/beta 1 domain-containing protein n=1 Tax=Cyanophyceae TaxID=3028117 RepID=UPI00168A443A|nr:HEAT repeat domain-containing protein [Coleofasciculus sp. FACHB-SPT36]MBD2541776.1 HEAT repeat domain-containing protein [Coleofasciculus sp. FACHB-SPT36]